MTSVTRPEIVALPMAQFRFADPELAGKTGVAIAYAVRHAAGVVLFDTGFGFGDAEVDAAYHPRSRRIGEALEEAGIEIGEVGAVVNCHLHADHAGQNAAFVGIPIYVQPVEFETAHTTDYTVLDWIDFAGADYRPIAGDHDLFPGVRVISTPGHTQGHQSLVVETAAGLTVLAGQAVYSVSEWIGEPTDLEGRTSAPDRSEYDRSIKRLRSLGPRRVLFGHDRRIWSGPAPA